MAPSPEPRFAGIAAMIGDPTRSRMLAALLDGALMTAGEIAQAAGVAPPTASAHLAKLVDAALVTVRSQGRHRYFRLADGDVAHALEALAAVADKDVGMPPARRLWIRESQQPLRHARTCYGHLAGRLGVRLHAALVERAVIVCDADRCALGPDRRVLDDLGLDAATVVPAKRGIAYPCVDWSERRDHLAGPLAVALLDHFIAQRWLVRQAGSRVLMPGPRTSRAFDALLGTFADARSPRR